MLLIKRQIKKNTLVIKNKDMSMKKLYLEFDAHNTKEAIFAYQCDKLECDLQSKLYEEDCVNLDKQEGNNTLKNKTVQELLKTGASWSTM